MTGVAYLLIGFGALLVWAGGTDPPEGLLGTVWEVVA